MSMNLVTLLYLVASVCFIQALKGLSHPTSSIRGNLFGMVGMAIAMLTTAALIVKLAPGSAAGMGWVLLGLVAGGGSAGQLDDQRRGGQHRDRHAGHAEQVAADRARRVAQALERLDEKYAGDEVQQRDEVHAHGRNPPFAEYGKRPPEGMRAGLAS